MLQLDSPIANIPKIQKPHIAALKKLGLETVRDLLLYFPYRYLDFSMLAEIKNLIPEHPVTIRGTIKSIESRFSFKSHLSLAEAIVSDETGSLKITWFNQPYLAKSLHKGDDVFLAGTPEYYKGRLQLTNPIYEKVSDFPIHTSRLVPLYRLPEKIYPKTFRSFIAAVQNLALELPENLPEGIRSKLALPGIADTVQWSHFPESPEHMQQAKQRLAFDEIFTTQLLAQKYKLELATKQSYAVPFNQELVKNFLSRLPFELTPGQKRAAWDILQDLEKPLPMNRLVEGDVGSGKTLVALIAALHMAKNGLQVAFLAPTEILARQHYETARTYISETSISLVTNNYAEIDGAAESKPKLQKLIAEGMPGVYIGTHALLADKVKFKKLALIIIDEQHRFGVEQRASLVNTKQKVPHLLSLTATPIPRTLQLAMYGELDISQIKTKPANRKAIVTKLVRPEERQRAYEFLRGQLQSGRQGFVITPLIEENDKLGVKAAKTEVENLKKVFREYSVGLMHGRLKGSEKEQVMADFLANKVHILVSTSVVEVGVDVPNASVMVIEGAERFGLSQLHQFRGRVGRAEHQSYCMLFSETQNPESLGRLEGFSKTQDGFELAELDLKQRGFGELYGSQQSGWNFKYFSPVYTSLLEPARQEAITLLKEDLALAKYPLLAAQIKDKVIHFE